MSKISKQTISFIFLFILAILGSYLCLMLWADLDKMPDSGFQTGGYPAFNSSTPTPGAAQQTGLQAVDTSAWKTYTYSASGFSFKYKPDWKVLAPTTKNGYTILQIDPGAKFFNIKIYISDKDFYVFSGLPTKAETIGGNPALSVNEALYGIKAGGTYYTFDVGFSMSLLPDFNALVHSSTFAN